MVDGRHQSRSSAVSQFDQWNGFDGGANGPMWRLTGVQFARANIFERARSRVQPNRRRGEPLPSSGQTALHALRSRRCARYQLSNMYLRSPYFDSPSFECVFQSYVGKFHAMN